MKKILIILNESYVPQQVIKRAIHIAKESDSLLEAIFINDINGLKFGYPFPNDLYLLSENFRAETRSTQSMNLLESLAQQFRDECNKEGIEYKVEIDKAVSIKHLLTLSSFADLIIADSKSDSDEYSLKDLLADAHCPLLLISKHAEPVEKIFVAYDGSASGMYAMKMFTYIFPEYKNLPINFFHIAAKDVEAIPHVEEIESWASKHFSNISFELIRGSVKTELVELIRPASEKNIIVMGAYSGSSITRLFLKSTAELVINETNSSLFITHL